MSVVALVLVSAALAGERVELWHGFQGRLPFGDPAVIDEPPLTSCEPGEGAARWTCHHQVGQVQVQLWFVVTEGVYVAYELAAEGRDQCAELQRILVAQYPGAMDGRVRDDGLHDTAWRERSVDAGFAWTPLGDACRFAAQHRPSMRRIAEAQERRAREAEGL